MIEPHELAKLSFEEAAPLWLASHRVHISEKTEADYRRYIKALCWLFRGVRLNEISISHLEQYQAARMAGDLGPKKKRAGPVCINHELGALCQLLKRAGLWRALDEHYKPLRIQKSTRGCALSLADEERLFSVMGSNRRWRVAYLCAVVTANTTAGPGEILNLRLRDLNLDADPPSICISQSIKRSQSSSVNPMPHAPWVFIPEYHTFK
jgi:hypothetical protein